MFAEAGVLTTWSPIISEAKTRWRLNGKVFRRTKERTPDLEWSAPFEIASQEKPRIAPRPFVYDLLVSLLSSGRYQFRRSRRERGSRHHRGRHSPDRHSPGARYNAHAERIHMNRLGRG